MRDSFELGQPFGIRLRVERPLVWFLLALVAWRLFGQGPVAALEVLLDLALLCALVLWHELGHALVAKRFGVKVHDITLWPLGGMARLEGMPEDARTETWISAAGPIANLALALVAFPVVLLLGLFPIWVGPLALVPWLASRLLVFNLVLGLSNLLPAFPMDGGRILRAQLARRLDWLEATERAVRVSRALAFGALVLGFLWSPVFLFLAAFVWWASWKELLQARVRHGSPQGFAGAFFDQVLRPRPRPTESEPAREEQGESDARASAERDFELRPFSKGGFSDADVERLERWRGRLPRTSSPSET